ncbi:MAG: histidine kinase [Lapillicoccus sp.]
MSGRASRVARRTAWLLLGAAIGLAAVLFAASLGAVLGEVMPVPGPVLVAVCLLPVGLIGVVPGVRGLKVQSARSTLDVEGDLVDPEHPGPDHRRCAATWVVLHLAMGLVVATLLFGVLPGGVVTAYTGIVGSELTAGGRVVPTDSGPWRAVVLVTTGLMAAALSLAVAALVGVLGRRWAPVFLGPTAADRLLMADARLAKESVHARLARELHDGIGHSLTIISVQAAAARRGPGGDEPAVDAPLEAIESTAQSALAELDTVLGLLRDDPAPRHPEPDLTRLEDLVEVYRQSGMGVTADLAGLEQPPALASRTVYRIDSEALSNAQRHGGPGLVELRVDGSAGQVRIDLWNPTRTLDLPATRGGHGLDGVRERVRLFGGTASSGLDSTGRWYLHASFPMGPPQ